MKWLLSLARLSVLTVPLAISASVPLAACGGGNSASAGGACCKVCSEGKACGDTCIEKTKTCNTGGGCACDK
jgi:hypothetical protein